MSTIGADEDDFKRALKEQFIHIEAYCNSQTRLHNALVDSRNGSSHLLHEQSLKEAIQNLSDCTERVQDNMGTLSSFKFANRNKQQQVKEHMARSKRALETIYEHGGKLSPLGIPVSRDDSEMKTVALATLRASIDQVEKVIDM